MSDGHLNKCKDCAKKDVRFREEVLRKDPEWVEKEKARARDKYHRLYNDGRYNPSPERKKEIMDAFKKRYPEKEKARISSSSLRRKGFEKHHWSYNEEHYKDVFWLTMKRHNEVHRFIEYDQSVKMYRALDGELLDTREKHEKYMVQISF